MECSCCGQTVRCASAVESVTGVCNECMHELLLQKRCEELRARDETLWTETTEEEEPAPMELTPSDHDFLASVGVRGW